MVENLKFLFGLIPGLRDLFEVKTAAEFDDFLDNHFESCVQQMEAEAHHLNDCSEEHLSAFLAAALRIPGLSVYREGYSNGHVDLTIKMESQQFPEQRLAEAKIYAGPAYHVKGIEQLVARYSTGRQSRGYVIEYVKQPGVSDIVIKLRKDADDHKPVQQQGVTSDHKMKWAYTSDHGHSSGEVIHVVHISVNLHR